jgi:four helix bundle protein
MSSERRIDLRERMFAFVCDVVRFCRGLSRRDFAAKNAISLKEMRETVYWLRIILSCNLSPAADVQPLLNEANQLTAMLTAGMKRLHPISVLPLALILRSLLSVLSS